MRIELAPKACSQNAVSHDTAEAWLKKHGNSMDKQKEQQKKRKNHWHQFGKIPTAKLVNNYLDNFGEIMPGQISDNSCANSVRTYCESLLKKGELVKFTVEKKVSNPGGGKMRKVFQAYKRA